MHIEENPGYTSRCPPYFIPTRLLRTLLMFTSDPVARTLGTHTVYNIRADDFLARLCPISASGQSWVDNLTATIRRIQQRNYRIICCQLGDKSGFVGMSLSSSSL
jgi:hypothetical protein